MFGNVETHWWDGSQVYGSGKERQAEVRTFVDGKGKVGDDGRLPKSDIPGIDLTGMRENWWVGVGLLHTLFAREHNAVCDALKKAYPSLGDQRLFELGVLVVSALIAKIHTVEWTPCVLGHPALQIGMSANWYGALGETFKDRAHAASAAPDGSVTIDVRNQSSRPSAPVASVSRSLVIPCLLPPIGPNARVIVVTQITLRRVFRRTERGALR